MPRFSLNAVGKDQPGIIAGVANALYGLGANLEDSRMTLLHGQFAMMLVFGVQNISDGGLIEGALEHVADELNLFIAVRPIPEDGSVPSGGERFSISVDGPDRPGLVAGIASALASLRANVVELSSRHFEQAGGRECVMRMSVVLPQDVSVSELEQTLETACGKLGVTGTVARGADDLT